MWVRLCAAFAAALAAPRQNVHCQAFNVGQNSEIYQIRDLAEIVKQVAPECSIEYAGEAGPDPRSYRVDFSKIKALLPEFQPQLIQLRHLMDQQRLASSLRWTNEPHSADFSFVTVPPKSSGESI